MTKTFTEKGIEYLLVEVPKDANNCLYDYFGDELKCGSIYYDDENGDQWGGETLQENYTIISLLKDITEEQAKEIMGWRDDWISWKPRIEMLDNALQLEGIDTSLNWLLLKKI